MKLSEIEIEFEFAGVQFHWEIVHNLPKTRGMSIGDALENYIARTDTPTDTGFCNYIQSKGFTAVTKRDFEANQN